jgi:hypothetical protein
MEHVIEKILKLVRSRKHEIGEQMIYGGVKDMEHYREQVGHVKALQLVEDEIVRLLNTVDREK